MKKYVMLLVCLVVMGLGRHVVCADTLNENYYHFRNVGSGLYLDCEGNKNNSNIRQLYYLSYLNPQKFLLMYNTNDYYAIFPYEAMELAVDVVEENVQVTPFNYGNKQNWKFISNGDGTYRIATRGSSDRKVMSVQGASMSSGANVVHQSYSGEATDLWCLEAVVEEGNYYIVNKETGKYLTATSSGYMRLLDKAEDDTDDQKFYIKLCSNRYYDIMPLSDLDKSVEVSSWYTGVAEEGCPISVSYGQSSSGQRWRFMLNADGSYRIGSEFSELKKAMTVSSNNSSYVNYVTYEDGNNAGWELIRIYDDQDYQKEGKHVIIDLDTETYLRKTVNGEQIEVISPQNLARWIQHLDAAYEKYEELVGKAPRDGRKMRIVPVGTERKVNTADGSFTLYTFCGSNSIFWNKDYIEAQLIASNQEDDWGFGVLHEMGHAFDVDNRWIFHSEFSANFKMAYVLRCFEGEFRITVGGRRLDSYEDLKEYYKSGSSTGYDKTLGASSQVFSNDGLQYMFMDRLDANNAWEALPATYTELLRDSKYVTFSALEKFNNFMDVISKKSETSFFENFKTYYSSQMPIITNYFSN